MKAYNIPRVFIWGRRTRYCLRVNLGAATEDSPKSAWETSPVQNQDTSSSDDSPPPTKYHKTIEKVTEEAERAFKKRRAELRRLEFQSMSQEQRERHNLMSRERMKKYRQRLKDKRAQLSHKRKTRAEEEKEEEMKKERRKKWREVKKKQREKKKRLEQDTECQTECDLSAGQGPSRTIIRSAKFRVKKVLPKDPRVCSIVLQELIGELSPEKTASLWDSGMLSTPKQQWK